MLEEEVEELTTDLRAVFGEVFARRHAAIWQPSDELLVLGVLLRRELGLVCKVKQGPACYAEGAGSGPTARPRGRKRSRGE